MRINTFLTASITSSERALAAASNAGGDPVWLLKAPQDLSGIAEVSILIGERVDKPQPENLLPGTETQYMLGVSKRDIEWHWAPRITTQR
jgi:hypothetical protein